MTTWCGFGLRFVSLGLFAAMAACVQFAVSEAALGQIVFFRGLFALLPLMGYTLLTSRSIFDLRTGRLRAHVVRGLIGGSALVLAFGAYALLPLVLATALSFLTPICTLAIASTIIGERFRFQVLVLLLIGLGGVALILVPEFQTEHLLATTGTGVACGVAAALLSAVALTLIRDLSTTEPPGRIAIYFCGIVSVMSLPTAILGWPQVSTTVALSMAAAGILGGLGHIAMTEAIARVQVSRLVVCDYSSLLWAGLIDVVLFNRTLTVQVVIGGLLVAGAVGPMAAMLKRETPTPPTN